MEGISYQFFREFNPLLTKLLQICLWKLSSLSFCWALPFKASSDTKMKWQESINVNIPIQPDQPLSGQLHPWGAPPWLFPSNARMPRFLHLSAMIYSGSSLYRPKETPIILLSLKLIAIATFQQSRPWQNHESSLKPVKACTTEYHHSTHKVIFVPASASSGFDDHPAIKEPILNLIQPKNQNEEMQSRPRT